MISLDLMELADCFAPEELVNCIFQQCPHLKAPIPVEQIAQRVGICEIQPLPGDSENIEGMLCSEPAKDCGVIFFNKSRPIGRQRFTIGHELGHFLLPTHASGERKCTASDLKKNSNTEESEANEFAQKLLLPSHLLTPEINDQSFNIELVNRLSVLFQMSFEATAIAAIPLSSEPVAIVFTKNCKVKYAWRNLKHFKYRLKVTKGSDLPESYEVPDLKANAVSEFIEFCENDWLEGAPKLGPELEIYGQTLVQEKGYSAILLKIKPLG